MNYFITAIHTNSGKTVVSAIVAEALKADYWKPVQSGLEERDSETVKKLISNTKTTIHPEQYLLHTPASPHYAAEVDNVHIHINDFKLPDTDNTLVIEGAGGILVPLNYEGDTVIDLAKKFTAEVIVVSNHYLGSINHTLLTISELKNRNLPIKGIIFNNCPNEATEKIILKSTGLKCLLRINTEQNMNSETVLKYAAELTKNWNG